MTEIKKDKKNQPEIHVRIKPNGSLLQMITLDADSLLELSSGKPDSNVLTTDINPNKSTKGKL